MPLDRSAKLLTGVLAVNGVLHVAKPEVYFPIMPSWVPKHREVVVWSGVAEMLLAAGLAIPATRRAAGWGSVALLLGVYPANLKLAADAASTDNTLFKAAAFGRLPLQAPMIRTALQAARGDFDPA